MNAAQSFRWLALIAVAVTGYRIWVIGHLGIDPYVDEAYYWGWSQALDWGYYSKPPVIAATIAAAEALLGHTLLALKLPALVCYPLTALLLNAIGCRMFSPRVGFWSALAFLTLPLVSTLGLFVSTDAPLLLFWALGIYGLVMARQTNAWRHWLLVGAAFGLGMMSKYTMIAFAGSALLVLLAEPGGRRQLLGAKPWVAFALGVLIFTPNLWWNAHHDFPTFRHTAEITRLESRGLAPGEFVEFIGAQWLSFGPLLTLGLLWAFLRTRRLWHDEAYRRLLLFVLPLLLLVSFQALTGRANGNWAAPVFVAASVLVIAFLADAGRWKLAIGAVALNAVLGVVVYHLPDIARGIGVELTAKSDPYKRARGWFALADQIAPFVAAHPGAVVVAKDRETLAQVIYRLQPPHYASWNPDGGVADHYQLTTDLNRYRNRPVLFLSRTGQIDDVAAHFETVSPLGEVVVPVHRNFERRLSLFLLSGFRGYPE
ncbi:ArnT family glycosyltransferase [Denitromonas iodatirespirans]|uniref:Glycosyltransferase family 39 protein n=1 Tax=Denitromonas iodatirespirans TaxID=2795389 RepID=A0A944HD58_DENI1|nr:glycosyltransferase family 39 protein [Denitromonas iodatirespirans]MBT0963397.1 glycosyltransferase family 39 protein [Denitromonas iodatirespirans]